MDENQDDDEMQGLFDQLDQDPDDYLTSQMEQESPTVVGDSSPPLEMEQNDRPPEAAPIPAIPPSTQEVRRIDGVVEESVPEPAAVEADPEPVVNIKEQFEQFDAIAVEVIQGTRHDRQETQDAINLCRQEINKAVNNGGNPSRMWLDNLTKALEIKATINLTAIKALEAKTKLLAATKAGVQVQNNTLIQNANVSTQADKSLVELLNSNPLDTDGDDEF